MDDSKTKNSTNAWSLLVHGLYDIIRWLVNDYFNYKNIKIYTLIEFYNKKYQNKLIVFMRD